MVQVLDASGTDEGWHPQRHTCADSLLPALCALRIHRDNPVARVACAADERPVLLGICQPLEPDPVPFGLIGRAEPQFQPGWRPALMQTAGPVFGCPAEGTLCLVQLPMAPHIRE